MIVRKRKKYEHGGVHPTGDERIPPSQRQREELSYDPIYNPTGGVLGGNFFEQVRQQVADITFPYAFGPYGAARGEARVGDVLGIGSDFAPIVGDAKEAARIGQDFEEGNYLDAAIGAGLFILPGAVASKAGPYIRKGADRLMNFLRPKADEAAETAIKALDAGPRTNMKHDLMSYADARFTPDQILAMEKNQFTNELKQIQDFIATRKREIMSPEGQRRLRNQMEADVDFMRQLASLDQDILEKMGFDATARIHMRMTLKKIDSDPDAYFNALQSAFNNRVGRIKDTTEAAQFDELAALERQIFSLQKAADDAFDGGNMENFNKLRAQIDKKGIQWQDKYDEIQSDMYNAFYDPNTNEIRLGKASLLHPDLVQTSTAHEFQHGLLSDQAFRKSFFDDRARMGQGVFQSGLPRTTEADRILHDELRLLDPLQITNKTGMSDRAQVELFSGIEYMKTPAFVRDSKGTIVPTGRGGTGSEMTPHLAELREQLVAEGIMKDRYSPITAADMQKYITNYRKRDPNFIPSNPESYTPQMGEEGVRILEYLDPSQDKANASALSKALNKMLVAVPAVGAAGIAAGTTADSGSSYYKGGKLKLKKEKRYGMRVV